MANQVAYDNYQKAFKIWKAKKAQGLPTTNSFADIVSAGNPKGEYNEDALRAWQSLKPKSSAPSAPSAPKKSSAPAASSAPSNIAPDVTSDNAPKPELNLPTLTMSEGASTLNQFNKLRSKDSVLKQQAIADANAYGVAGGTIHSANQAAVTERAIEDRLMPLAQAEASLVASTDINNWQQQSNQYMTVYKAEFEDYLKDKGYDNDMAIARVQSETALANTLLNQIGNLLNNTDLDLGPEAYNKLIDPYNSFNTTGWFNYA